MLRFGDFSGQLKEDLLGLYLSPYKASAGEERTMVVSLFEPTFARKAFPCFDEPTFKAVYKVSVTHPRYNLDKVLFNTDLERSEDAETGWVREIFEETQKMSTYLLGFVIGDLTSMEIETQRGRKIRVWSRPDVIQQMTFALNYAEQCYIYFDNYFSGIEDPTPKTDIVAVPTFMAAGMEHWGLITCFEPYILYEESTSPIRKRNLVSELVAHEIAHSWFGNLVSLTSWADLWLKEGFATFFSIEAMQSIDPSSDAFDVSVVEVVQRALGIDSYPLSHPMTDPDVDDVSIILSNYDEITYYKGISVVRMLQTMLGDDSFRDGLMSYLRKYEYGNANADDLWAELTEISGSNPDIKEVMDTWILQQGYPVVTVTRETPSSRQLSVEQSLFLIKPDGTTFDLTTGEFGYKWYVHFMYNSRDAIPVKDQWMNKGNIELTIPTLSSEQWVQGNVELSSFLRVNYDLNNWELIIAQLTTDHLVYSEASRAAIVDDAFHLQRAGLLDTQIALRVTSYLTEEDSYLPWEAAYRGFQYLSARLYLTGSYGKFQACWSLHVCFDILC
ncbi:thyrotropin-releasing hormone-degrading ectoenzyme-like [Ptychodera flava]|uniref:thyrotropin-releasing hormone-degrading ectoenzyme-like n=1 Tax=Ptychodera flava TaxID=63121 RepID=UPI00396AA326